jgi:hypothetical protein
MNVLKFALGLGLVLVAVATPAYATPVPEISADGAASAITLLAGGYLMLSARFRSRK